MQTVTVQLHNLEEKHLIKIVDDSDTDSPSLPGKPLALKAFKEWIAKAETTNTVSLKDAKQKWDTQRKKLQKLTK